MSAYLLLLLLALPFAAQHGDEAANRQLTGDPKAIAAGAALYQRSCAGCHGVDGSGGRGPNLVRRPMWHSLTDDRIFDVIRNGVPGADMPPTHLSDEETWQLVAFFHALTGPAAENPAPGDPDAGERVFWSKKAGCAGCHSVAGRGGRLGPDLTNIGGLRPLASIKESVLEPGQGLILLGREAVSVRLRDGRTLHGVGRNRDNYSLQLIDESGALHLLWMRDIVELEIRERSPMPSNYEERLSRTELDNLFAFLSRQTLRDLPEEHQ